MDKKTICIDFDGVLATYDGWKGRGDIGEPISGASEATQTLKKEGYTIIVFTTRKSEDVKDGLKRTKYHTIILTRIPTSPKTRMKVNLLPTFIWMTAQSVSVETGSGH